MIFEKLADKCKYYQELANYKLMPNGYILAHLDGRGFSNYCKRFEKPFDKIFVNAMNESAIYVAKNVQNCKLAYVQSDEITLVIVDSPESDTFFKYRVSKLCSIMASMVTAKFMQLMMLELAKTPCSQDDLLEMINKETLVQFDCKVWNVPNLNEVYAWLNFRQIDCIRNSKQQFAQTHFSHNRLMNKNTDEQIEMVKAEKGIDWEAFENGLKYGRFISKTNVNREFIDKKGEAHNVLRTVWIAEDGFPIQSEEDREKFLDKYGLKENDC